MAQQATPTGRPWRRRVCTIPPYPEPAGGAPRSTGLLLRTACHYQHHLHR